MAQKDIIDVLKDVLKIKSNPDQLAGFDSKKYHFSILPAAGYTLQTRLAAILASNVGFYTGTYDSTAKLSTVASSLAVTENSQIVVPIESDIWSKDGKYNFTGDWRISKYPQDTYGLGSNNSLDSAELIDYSYIRVYQTVFRRMSPNFYFGLGYNLDYHWNIEDDGYDGPHKPNQVSDFVKYNGSATKTVSSGVSLDLLYDGRDNSIDPLSGEYANIVFRNNYTFLGSDENWKSLIVDLRKYIPVGHQNNVLAFWSYDWLVLEGTPPYLDLPSTSWDTYTNTGRGYIQGRFRSNQMLYLEAEYRFGLTRNGLLGGVVFTNGQAFSVWPGNYTFNTIQPAAGLGLRVRINKITRTNIDIDYGFGLNNSHGLFINIAEVF